MPKFALAGRTGNGNPGNPFRADVDMVEEPGSHFGCIVLPTGEFLLEYEGTWRPGSQHQDLGEYALTDPLPPGARGQIAQRYGAQGNELNGMTIGEAMAYLMDLVPAKRSNGRRWEVKIGKQKIYDAPVIEGGAVVSDAFTYSDGDIDTVSSNVWKVLTGNDEPTIASNEAKWSSSANKEASAVYDTSLSADMTVDSTLTGVASGNGKIGLIGRSDAVDDQNLFYNSCDNNHELFERTTGSDTSLAINWVVGKYTGTPNSLQLDLQGTSIDSDWDGDTLSSTDSSHSDHTYAGIMFASQFGVSFTQDDWSCTYTAAGGGRSIRVRPHRHLTMR
jgi:hypothetical protein